MRSGAMLGASKNSIPSSSTCCFVVPNSSSSSSDIFPSSSDNGVATHKRKRRPAGTPDPEAEVVSLSPRTLLESDRYICEICNQGFQRDQNLQMHRRRHKVPWKLLKRDNNDQEVKKRVYVCPEPSCLHHDPRHALGDLVGIKKHFRRKHSEHKQWVCQKCSKGYAVQSDYKAHLKTCGTRGHSCDCGRVFSRVESFIEHQDSCKVRRATHHQPPPPAACPSRTTSIASTPSSDAVARVPPQLVGGQTVPTPVLPPIFICSRDNTMNKNNHLELQLLPFMSDNPNPNRKTPEEEPFDTNLNLFITPLSHPHNSNISKCSTSMVYDQTKELAGEDVNMAMKEKTYVEEVRQEAKRQREMAEIEYTNAKRIRQQAQAELERAKLLKEQATKKISAAITHVTCQSCKRQFPATAMRSFLPAAAHETSVVVSYVSGCE
ncbi:PREDICTED: protein SHOOT GRAVITROPISM 5-like [Tarenaya hassleriana]|uniref:protein SHOOT GRAVITROPISM 5-like n=1 Tax=Tarenaya hassleriana TaxID=28532 RepID=UPI00053C827D|nr:PREDICTED: protein SHOOT GRAVITROPISM 5-like [Tarenaya hassleriana]